MLLYKKKRFTPLFMEIFQYFILVLPVLPEMVSDNFFPRHWSLPGLLCIDSLFHEVSPDVKGHDETVGIAYDPSTRRVRMVI